MKTEIQRKCQEIEKTAKSTFTTMWRTLHTREHTPKEKLEYIAAMRGKIEGMRRDIGTLRRMDGALGEEQKNTLFLAEEHLASINLYMEIKEPKIRVSVTWPEKEGKKRGRKKADG